MGHDNPFGKFAALMVQLEDEPSIAELLQGDRSFESQWKLMDAIVKRARLLERFHQCVTELHRDAEERISRGSKPEQRAAILNFAKSMGLLVLDDVVKPAILLIAYVNALMDLGEGPKLVAAWKVRRRADIPIVHQRAAVTEIRRQFGIASWGAARRQLTDARSAVEGEALAELVNLIPIPGGDLGGD